MTANEGQATLPFVKCTNRHPMFISAEWIEKIGIILATNGFPFKKDISCVGKQRKNRNNTSSDKATTSNDGGGGGNSTILVQETHSSIVSVSFENVLYARTHNYCENSYRIEMRFDGAKWSRNLLTIFFGNERNTFFFNAFTGTVELITMMIAAQQLYGNIQILNDHLEAYIGDIRGTMAYDRNQRTGRYMFKGDFLRNMCNVRSDLEMFTAQLIHLLLRVRHHVLTQMEYAVRSDTLFPLYESRQHLTAYDFIEKGRTVLYDGKIVAPIVAVATTTLLVADHDTGGTNGDYAQLPTSPLAQPRGRRTAAPKKSSGKKKQTSTEKASAGNGNDMQELPSSDEDIDGDGTFAPPLNGLGRPVGTHRNVAAKNDAFLVYDRHSDDTQPQNLPVVLDDDDDDDGVGDDDGTSGGDDEPVLEDAGDNVTPAAYHQRHHHHIRHTSDPAILAMSPSPTAMLTMQTMNGIVASSPQPPPPPPPINPYYHHHTTAATAVAIGASVPPPRPASTSAIVHSTYTTPMAQFIQPPHEHGCQCAMCIQILRHNMYIAQSVSSQYELEALAYNQHRAEEVSLSRSAVVVGEQYENQQQQH